MLLKEIGANYQVFEYGDFDKFKQMFKKFLIDNPELLKENDFVIAQHLIHEFYPLDYLKIEPIGDVEDDYILSYIQEEQSKSLYKIFDGSFIDFISDLKSRLSSSQYLKNE